MGVVGEEVGQAEEEGRLENLVLQVFWVGGLG